MVIYSIEFNEMHIWPVVVCGGNATMLQIRSTVDGAAAQTMWIEKTDIDATGKVTNYGIRERLTEQFPLYFRVPYIR